MNSVLEQIGEWLKELLVSAIMNQLTGLFDSVNTQVGDIATKVGTTPANFSPGVFAMIRNVILASEADSTYTVYTFNKSLKKRLAKFMKNYAEHGKLVDDTGDGGLTYEIDKGRLSLRLVPPYSEERQHKMKNIAKEKLVNNK